MQQERDKDNVFSDELLKAVNDDSLNVNYMIIMREKWINKFNSFKDPLPCKYYLHLYKDENNVNRVEFIDPKSRQTHLPEFSVNIQPGLAGKIWNDIREAAPYLQLVMSRLWEEAQKAKTPSQTLQVETYSGLGGATEIVRDHLYKQLEQLNNDDRKIAIRLLYYFVTPSGTQLALTVDDLCRFVNDNRFIDEPELKPDQVHPLLEHFSQGRSRVLCPVASNCYQIYFSMLADVIFSWLQGLRKIKYLEQEAQQSMQRFEMFQLDALLKAIEIGQALREKINRHTILEEEDSVLTVIWALQTIIDSIQEKNKFRAPKGAFYSINFSFDGQQLAIGASDGSVLLYDLQKKQLNKLCDFPKPVYYVTFNPNGKKLAIAVGDGTILLWDLQSRQTLTFTAAGSSFYCISFSLDGQKMVAASGHGLVCLWDLESKEQIQCRQNFPIFASVLALMDNG